MKKLAFIIILIVIMSILLSVAAFYSEPFVRGNNYVVAANKTVIEECNETDWVSLSDIKKIQLLSDDTILADTNITVRTTFTPKWYTWREMSICYHFTAVARDMVTNDVIEEKQGTVILTFLFKDMQWIVVSVDKES